MFRRPPKPGVVYPPTGSNKLKGLPSFDKLRMTLVRLRMTLVRLRMTLVRLRMTLVRLRMTLVRLRMTLVRLRMTLVRLRMTLVRLRMTLEYRLYRGGDLLFVHLALHDFADDAAAVD